MKSCIENSWRSRRALTLVELLAVIAILGLLASLALPAIARTKRQQQIQRARVEIAQLVSALTEYETAYGRFPISSEACRASALTNEDITYGGVLEETHSWLAGPAYLTDNAEVVAGLLDLEFYGNGVPTINAGHAQNPRRIRFLETNLVGGTNAVPGVGPDGVYRDPWNSPYVITLDLNGDGRARDIMYRQPEVSQNLDDPNRGINGLTKAFDASGSTVFEMNGRVMIWCAGPDRRLDTHQKANIGLNRDNVVSWR